MAAGLLPRRRALRKLAIRPRRIELGSIINPMHDLD